MFFGFTRYNDCLQVVPNGKDHKNLNVAPRKIPCERFKLEFSQEDGRPQPSKQIRPAKFIDNDNRSIGFKKNHQFPPLRSRLPLRSLFSAPCAGPPQMFITRDAHASIIPVHCSFRTYDLFLTSDCLRYGTMNFV